MRIMKAFPIKPDDDKMETTRILMTSAGKDSSKMLHSVSRDEMLEGPDEFVAESMPLPANFAPKKYVCGRIETFVQVTHQP